MAIAAHLKGVAEGAHKEQVQSERARAEAIDNPVSAVRAAVQAAWLCSLELGRAYGEELIRLNPLLEESEMAIDECISTASGRIQGFRGSEGLHGLLEGLKSDPRRPALLALQALGRSEMSALAIERASHPSLAPHCRPATLALGVASRLEPAGRAEPLRGSLRHRLLLCLKQLCRSALASPNSRRELIAQIRSGAWSTSAVMLAKACANDPHETFGRVGDIARDPSDAAFLCLLRAENDGGHEGQETAEFARFFRERMQSTRNVNHTELSRALRKAFSWLLLREPEARNARRVAACAAESMAIDPEQLSQCLCAALHEVATEGMTPAVLAAAGHGALACLDLVARGERGEERRRGAWEWEVELRRAAESAGVNASIGAIEAVLSKLQEEQGAWEEEGEM